MPLTSVMSQLRASSLALTDGKAGLPALRFKREPGTGLRRPGAGQLALDVQSTTRLAVSATGVNVTGALSVSNSLAVTAGGAQIGGNSQVSGTLAVTGLLTAQNGLAIGAGGLAVPVGGLAVSGGPVTIAQALTAQAGLTVSGGNTTISGGALRTAAAYWTFLDNLGVPVGAKVASLVISPNYSDPAPSNGLYVYGPVSAASGLTVTASGTGSIRPLTLKRTSDPANNGDETSLDVQNAAGTVVARLAAYRVSATGWGWKLYTSTGGSLSVGLLVDDTTKVTTAALDAVGLVRVLSGGLQVTGALAMQGSNEIVPAPVSGTPAQHGLYRENVVKAWARVNSAGGLRAGFNVGTPTRNATGDYTVPFLRGFSDVYYAFAVTPNMNGAFFVAVPTVATGYVGVKAFNSSGAAADVEFSLIAIGPQ